MARSTVIQVSPSPSTPNQTLSTPKSPLQELKTPKKAPPHYSDEPTRTPSPHQRSKEDSDYKKLAGKNPFNPSLVQTLVNIPNYKDLLKRITHALSLVFATCLDRDPKQQTPGVEVNASVFGSIEEERKLGLSLGGRGHEIKALEVYSKLVETNGKIHSALQYKCKDDEALKKISIYFKALEKVFLQEITSISSEEKWKRIELSTKFRRKQLTEEAKGNLTLSTEEQSAIVEFQSPGDYQGVWGTPSKSEGYAPGIGFARAVKTVMGSDQPREKLESLLKTDTARKLNAQRRLQFPSSSTVSPVGNNSRDSLSSSLTFQSQSAISVDNKENQPPQSNSKNKGVVPSNASNSSIALNRSLSWNESAPSLKKAVQEELNEKAQNSGLSIQFSLI